MQHKLAPAPELPSAYIVEQKLESPILQVIYTLIYPKMLLSIYLMGSGQNPMLYINGSSPHGHLTVKFTYAQKIFS